MKREGFKVISSLTKDERKTLIEVYTHMVLIGSNEFGLSDKDYKFVYAFAVENGVSISSVDKIIQNKMKERKTNITQFTLSLSI